MTENEHRLDESNEIAFLGEGNTAFVPLQEIELSPERHNVLGGLLEIRDEGRNLGQYLVQQFLAGRRIIIKGEPSTGKSALFFQLLAASSENAEHLGLAFDKRSGQYDFILEMERRRRKRLGQGGKLEDEAFNERIYEEMMKSDIFEVPAVGSKGTADRGRSAEEHVERNIANGSDSRSLIVSLYNSPLVQTYGEYLRTIISEAPVKRVFRLLDEYGMNIEGVLKSNQNAKYIKEVFKLMANSEHIRNIRQEVSTEIADWHLDLQVQRLAHQDYNSPLDIIADRGTGLHLVPVEPSDFRTILAKFGIKSTTQSEMFFQKKAFDARQDMANQAVYMEWIFRDKLGLGSDKAIVAGNPYDPRKTVYDFTPLLSNLPAA